MAEESSQMSESILETSMTLQHVVELYAMLEHQGVEIWIDGGWGVDALLCEQTRPHADLDIAIQWKDVLALRQWLRAQGYEEIRQDSKWNFVLSDEARHEIDVHAFVFDGAGEVVEGIMYPAQSLTGTGLVGGRPVRCISAEYAVKFHTGYKLREKDIQDVKALCERFGIEYPDEYTHLKRPG